MFDERIKDAYIAAAGEYENSKHNGTPKDRQEYLRGYMDAMERAKDMFDELFDPPMSDEGYLSSQAAELIKMAANA